MFYIDDKLKLIINYKDGKIEDIFDYENQLIGNIYRGRVEKVVRSMNAAFVDIGGEENAYLSLKDTDRDISEGDDILCQIKKIPPENKAPRLTMELSVGGRYIVYFPRADFVKFSSKLSADEIKSLKELKLRGVLYRTAAGKADKEDILREYRGLSRYRDMLRLEENRKPTPKELYSRNGFADYIFKNASDDEITVNSKDIYTDLKDSFSIELDGSFSIIYSPDILREYKSLFEKRINLENGGNIVIERTESLTAVDVNTASFTGEGDFEDTVFENNVLAAREMARQIILRNISGIIIADFVDMKKKSHRDALIDVLREEFKKDSSRSRVYGYTRLNLVEISRKNNGEELKLKI